MTAAEVLRKAADDIEEHGWTQGKFNSNGAACAIGAINRSGAPCGTVAWEAAVHALSLAVMDEVAAPWLYGVSSFVYHWNDAPGRTSSEVIATLRRVADELEAQP